GIIADMRALDVKLEWILETHAHADHLSAAPQIRDSLGGRIAIGEGIRQVQAHFSAELNFEAGFHSDGSQFDHLFKDGERFHIGQLDARVIATPGHTRDSVSYLIGDALFVGDTLFMPDGGTAR
ncbi:metallo-beta-lactamase superfamily protein, partial [mine drainage metagenome]